MGSVVISIDAELAWGFHDKPRLPRGRIAGARRAWQDTLDALDRHGIAATWAVVGHLMLPECDGVHADLPTPAGWFSRDPGGPANAADRWMAPGLVRAILDADQPHEIASHTFSHLDLGASSVTPEMVDADLARHRAVANEWGLNLRSFVFPRNRIGHRDRLSDAGFRCYRGAPSPRWYDNPPFRRPKKALDFLLGPAEPPLVQPIADEFGLVNLPASLHLFGFEGAPGDVARSFGKDPIVAAAEAGIAAAAEREGIFHAWFHPNNLTSPTDRNRLDRILGLVNGYDVPVRTMGAAARSMRPAAYA